MVQCYFFSGRKPKSPHDFNAMVVAELLQWGAPTPFILLRVLLGFYQSALQTEDLNFRVSICRDVAAHSSPSPYQQDLDYMPHSVCDRSHI